ncbi:MAG TPA: adenylate/guanylate cyclase domain-containing protein [Dehalococcoidia bacterium]|nr:adenylate/guanylate cyclase domain-containing protein [Dehalococcoidia bacterium]
MTNLIWSHAQLEWRIPEFHDWYQRFAERRRLIRFDPRGTGLSDRLVEEYSLQSFERDVEAVVERLELDSFALFACINAGPVAISFAAHHPESVSHLILWCSWGGAPYYQHSRWQSVAALQPLMESDWETYTEIRARTELGWNEGQLSQQYAGFLQECTEPKGARQAYKAIEQFDIEPLLAHIVSPTLVVHRRQFSYWDEEASKNLAIRIPNARLALVEGAAAVPVLGHTDAEIHAIEEFLSVGVETVADSAPTLPSGLTAILFADIVDSTALTERLGDAAFRERARDLDASLRTIIREAGGTPIEGKLLGDGVLATFASARQAIEAALTCGKAGHAGGLPLHLGLHAGDVIREDDNVFGGAVNIASRISGLSAPGEVLVSDTVRSLARTSAGVTFEDRGEHALKGIEGPVRMWAVREKA